MFSRVKVHGEGFSEALSVGIHRLVSTVLSLERVSADVQLDLFLLSPSDMQQIHLVSKGKNTPTDALTFSEDRGTTRLVHALLFDPTSDKIDVVDAPSRNKQETNYHFNCSRKTSSSSITADSGRNPQRVFSVDQQKSGIHERRLTALQVAQNFEESRAALMHLGEIYLCPDFMLARIQRYPHRSLPFPIYMRAAVVHATLHALGYDHESPMELKAMVKKEQAFGLKLRQLEKRYPQMLRGSFLVKQRKKVP